MMGAMIKDAAYHRAYYAAHRDHRIEATLSWRDRNRARYNAYMAEYRRRKRAQRSFTPPAGAETLAQALGATD